MSPSSRWRAAWDAQTRLADRAPWHLPPRIPVEEIADIKVARSGRFAIIVGYAGVHRLDLETMRSAQILSDARTDRTAVISADERQAAVYDAYGPCLHVFDLEAQTQHTIEGAQAALRARMTAIGRRRGKPAGGLRQDNQTVTLSTDDGPIELRPPIGPFTRILDKTRAADGRAFVAAAGQCDARAEAPSQGLFVFDAQGTLLGTVHLALRGRGASMVFVDGKAVTVASLAAAGVSVATSANGEAEAAMARFQPQTPDGRDEVVFGRSVAGFLGRLDIDAPLGERAFGYEEIARARRALLGQAPLDDAAQRAALDAATRLRFWTARFESMKTVEVAFNASAGLTPLLPEIAQRITPNTNKAARRQLTRICGDMARLAIPEQRVVFEAMCARLDAEATAAELAGLIEIEADTLFAAAKGDRVQLKRFVDAVKSGEIGLQGCTEALIELALPRLSGRAGLPGLPGLTRVWCGSTSGAHVLRVMLGHHWPALTVLDAHQAPFADDLAFALATSRGFPRLETLQLPADATALGRALLHFSPRLPALGLAERAAIATLLVDHRLDDALRVEMLRAANPSDRPDRLHLVAETMPGVDLVALLERLATHDTPLTLEGFDISGALLEHLPASSALRRCGLDVEFTLDVALRVRDGRPAPTVEGCRTPPVGMVALYALAGLGAPSPVVAIQAFLCSPVPTDAIWFAVVEAGLERALDPFEAGFTALSATEADGLIDRRPDVMVWAFERRQMVICATVARRLIASGWTESTLVLSGSAMVGPLLVAGFSGSTWTIRPVSSSVPFTCGREQSMAVLGRLLGPRDVQTGDADFDALAELDGPRAVVLERLDAPRRMQWSAALRAGIRLRSFGLEGLQPFPTPDVLGQLLTTLFDGPKAVPRWRQLVRRFETEPQSGVRAQLLRCLLDDVALPDPQRHQVHVRAVADPDAAVRAIGAEAIWPAVEAAPDLTIYDGPTLAAVLDRLSGAQTLAAVAHLGAVGDERCVGVLVEAGTGLFKGRTLRDATQAAIAEITRRVGGLRTGGLSVAEGGHGGLSTPHDPPEDAPEDAPEGP